MPFKIKADAQNKLGVLLTQYENANKIRKTKGLRSEEVIGIVEEMRSIEKEMFKLILDGDIFIEIPRCADHCWCKRIPNKKHDVENF